MTAIRLQEAEGVVKKRRDLAALKEERNLEIAQKRRNVDKTSFVK